MTKQKFCPPCFREKRKPEVCGGGERFYKGITFPPKTPSRTILCSSSTMVVSVLSRRDSRLGSETKCSLVAHTKEAHRKHVGGEVMWRCREPSNRGHTSLVPDVRQGLSSLFCTSNCVKSCIICFWQDMQVMYRHQYLRQRPR